MLALWPIVLPFPAPAPRKLVSEWQAIYHWNKWLLCSHFPSGPRLFVWSCSREREHGILITWPWTAPRYLTFYPFFCDSFVVLGYQSSVEVSQAFHWVPVGFRSFLSFVSICFCWHRVTNGRIIYDRVLYENTLYLGWMFLYFFSFVHSIEQTSHLEIKSQVVALWPRMLRAGHL